MSTRFAERYCDRCQEKTRHKIEENSETGWSRERCMPCWNSIVEASKGGSTDGE